MTVVLRLLILKHLYDWSFDECERVVRGSLVYRGEYCRIDGERVPDAKTLIRLSQLLGPETLKPILERIVRLTRQRRVTRGARMRVDTTVVETNIHYPTDSSLLADGVRVLTRTTRRVATRVGDGVLQLSGIAPAASPGGSSRSSSGAAPPAGGRPRRRPRATRG